MTIYSSQCSSLDAINVARVVGDCDERLMKLVVDEDLLDSMELKSHQVEVYLEFVEHDSPMQWIRKDARFFRLTVDFVLNQ